MNLQDMDVLKGYRKGFCNQHDIALSKFPISMVISMAMVNMIISPGMQPVWSVKDG